MLQITTGLPFISKYFCGLNEFTNTFADDLADELNQADVEDMDDDGEEQYDNSQMVFARHEGKNCMASKIIPKSDCLITFLAYFDNNPRKKLALENGKAGYISKVCVELT